jgi:hypothetical protein
MRNPAFPSFLFVVAACAGLAIAGPATAACTYNSLSASSPVSSSVATTLYTFTSPDTAWGAIGIRSASGSEHDVTVYAQTAGSPTCVQGPVGSSALAGGVDFVVGDFRPGRTTAGPWYAQVDRSSGSGSVLTEWDPGNAKLTVDDTPVVHNTNQVLDVYSVFLEAGQTYTIVFAAEPGVDAKVLLFKNPGTTAYWASRSGSLLESTGNVQYAATTSDYYALVVVNDDGGLSTYQLAVDQCQLPTTLASGTAVSTSPPLRYDVPQDNPYWSAAGVRGSGSDDWDMIAYKSGLGSHEPVCFSDSVAASARRGAGVDFVVGDFNYNPVTDYFVRATEFAGSQAGVLEWDDGPDEIPVNAPPVSRSPGSGTVLEAWDVYMNAGSTYSIFFQRSGAADARYFVFENPILPPDSSYWAGRTGAALTGIATAGYAPSVTGYHGIVVVNDNGGAGSYQLAVYGTGAGVGDGGPGARPGIESLAPNPARGSTVVRYRLATAGRAAFDLLDASGRQVARMAEFDAAPGEGSLTWEARGGGRRVPPGLYFMRLRLGGKLLSIKKFLLLP